MRLCYALILASTLGFAQDRVFTVCVGVPASDPRLLINTGFQQNQLVALITARGKGKKAKVKMTAVPLAGSTVAELSREVENSACDYVVVSEFVAVGGSYAPEVSRIPGIGPASPTSRRAADLSYTLTDAESGRPVREGRINVSPMGDQEDGVLQATRELAHRVFEDVTRARRRLQTE